MVTRTQSCERPSAASRVLVGLMQAFWGITLKAALPHLLTHVCIAAAFQVQQLQDALLQHQDAASSSAAAVQPAVAESPTARLAFQQHAAAVQAQLELQYRQNLAALQEECEGLRQQSEQQRVQLKVSQASTAGTYTVQP